MVNNLSIPKSFIICRIYLMLIIVLTFVNKISFADDIYDKDFSGNSVSIFFIIDNSTSMSGTTNDTNDQWGNRFIITRDIIDTLWLKYRKSEVGVAVFRKYLYFDPVDDDRLVQCPQQDTGAYLPLFRIDSSYAPDGKLGWGILHEWLETDTINNDHVGLYYVPSNVSINPSGTNINSGFDAAKHAMLSSQYPPEEHFIIFFSDGMANHPQDGTQNDYIQGTDVPTTFTIYFTLDDTVLTDLLTMAENIKNNGYSSSNPLTNVWAIESDHDKSLKLLMDSVITKIFDPTHIDLSNDNYTNKNFVFINSLNAKTIINYTINDNSNIILDIYTIQGRKVCSLVSDFKKAGSHQAVWGGTDKSGVQVSKGCYIIRFVCDKQKITKSFILTH